jgi:hypothetical protein
MKFRSEYCSFDQFSGFVMKYYPGSKLAGLGQQYPRPLNLCNVVRLTRLPLVPYLAEMLRDFWDEIVPLAGGVAGFHHMPGTLHSRRTRRVCKDDLPSVVLCNFSVLIATWVLY